MKALKFGTTEVLVHINEELNKQHRENLSEQVNNLNGISTVLMIDHKPHLMRVSYDPQAISYLQVLEGVKNNGVHAQLAAWL